MIDPALLEILRCPESYQTLRVAEQALVQTINDRINAGSLKNRAGQVVTEKMEGALLRADAKLIYPIRGEIPVMLINEAIPLP